MFGAKGCGLSSGCLSCIGGRDGGGLAEAGGSSRPCLLQAPPKEAPSLGGAAPLPSWLLGGYFMRSTRVRLTGENNQIPLRTHAWGAPLHQRFSDRKGPRRGEGAGPTCRFRQRKRVSRPSAQNSPQAEGHAWGSLVSAPGGEPSRSWAARFRRSGSQRLPAPEPGTA